MPVVDINVTAMIITNASNMLVANVGDELPTFRIKIDNSLKDDKLKDAIKDICFVELVKFNKKLDIK